MSDSSSLESLTACNDGMIGLGANCSCGNPSCLFATLRSFLPSKELINNYLKTTNQDRSFSKEFSRFLSRNARFEKHRGFPLDLKCQTDPDPQKLCQSSFGKFLRYNSILEYARFNLRVFLKNETDSLYDILYPEKFRWAENIRDCDQGWDCAFEDMSMFSQQEDPMNEQKLFQSDFLNKAIHIVESRSKRRNHIIQIIIYGKLLSMLSRPNGRTLQFINKTLERTNIDIPSAAKNIIQQNIITREKRRWKIRVTNVTEALTTKWQPAINWLSCENNDTILFALSIRFPQKRIVYNSRVDGIWSKREGSIAFPSSDMYSNNDKARHTSDEFQIEIAEKPHIGFEIFVFNELSSRVIFPLSQHISSSKACNITVNDEMTDQPLHSTLHLHEMLPIPLKSETDVLEMLIKQNDNSSSSPSVSMHVRHGKICVR